MVLMISTLSITAQQTISNELLANNKTNNTITKEVTTPSNIVYTDHIKDLPKEAIDWCIEFAKRKNYINTINSLSKKYFPKVNKIFIKNNIPTELNMLLPIESFFNKNCVSNVGAVGYWQFMNQTAVEYGLSIDSAKDERKDFHKSTRAAARYLKNSYAVLHDWYLTVASYNCGVGNVKKAITKSGKTNPTFFEIKSFLPKESQNYVMKYIALNLLIKNYSLYSAEKMRWYSTTETVIEPTSTVAAVPAIESFK
jgi:membrane-bound lytic murein transglycosylase MltF